MSVGIQKSPAIKVPVVPDPIPTPLITQNALVLRPLSGRPSCLPLGIWPLVLCSVIMGPAPANSEANRDRARPWLPSLRDSIPRCSVSAEKVSTITCILEPSSPRSVSSLSQPARCLSVPGQSCPPAQVPFLLASSVPGILKCVAQCSSVT